MSTKVKMKKPLQIPEWPHSTSSTLPSFIMVKSGTGLCPHWYQHPLVRSYISVSKLHSPRENHHYCSLKCGMEPDFQQELRPFHSSTVEITEYNIFLIAAAITNYVN